MSSQCRNRAIARHIGVSFCEGQVRSDFDTLPILVNLYLNAHLAQDALKPLHEVLILPPVFLHAKQKPVYDRIIAWLQVLFSEDLFVSPKERA
jgi:hypothetical protein